MVQINDLVEFRELIKENEIVYIVGAGSVGNVIGRYLIYIGFDNWVFVDGKRKGEFLLGKEVIDFCEINNGFGMIVASVTNGVLPSVLQSLSDNDICIEDVYLLSNRRLLYEMMSQYDNLGIYTKRIRKLKNKHSGKRCFIIGTGPSLTISDLELLKDEYTFSVNSVYALFPFTFWRPTYYFVTDALFLKQLISEGKIEDTIIRNCNAFFTPIIGPGFADKELKNNDRVYFLPSIDSEIVNGKGEFSSNCDKEVFTSGTVVYQALQIAAYMGFSEIYLLGIDFSFSVEKKMDGRVISNAVTNHNHIIELEEKKYESSYDLGNAYFAEIDKQEAGYMAAKEYADNNGIHIYNATRGGKLEVFERVILDGLF